MIYTPLTCKAMKVSYLAHHGQLDKAGVPYIFHPLHLAEQMQDEISCCAALLHDVVEDTAVTLEDLASEFPPEIIEVLQLLTHEVDTDYFDYIRRIRANPIAVKVKLADIAHNSDPHRLQNCTVSENTKQNLRSKYANAMAILLED